MFQKGQKPQPPHPDAEVLRQLVKTRMKPGGDLGYEELEKAIGQSVRGDSPGYRRLATAIRLLAELDAINVVVVPGVGIHYQTSVETLARNQQRDIPAARRKARKAGRALRNVNPDDFDADQKAEYFAARMLNNVLYAATRAESKKKLLAAAKAAPEVLPMAKALEILKNGG